MTGAPRTSLLLTFVLVIAVRQTTAKPAGWLKTMEHGYRQLAAALKKQQLEIDHLKKEIKRNQPCKAARGVINWRQKTVRQFDSDIDNGHLLSMIFKKKRDDTHLRLTWSSNMRQYLRNKCSQWFFRIDGRECSNPAPINANVFHHINGGSHLHNNDHRHGTLIGVCRGTSAGTFRSGSHQITMNVRTCPGFDIGHAFTGWASTTTMMVEELCPPQ